MTDYSGFHWTNSMSIRNSVCPNNEYQKNKYIFVKRNKQNILKGSTILVNPRFKDNAKVFINPNFSANTLKHIVPTRAHIYVNPRVIKSIPSIAASNPAVQTSPLVNRYPLKVIPTDISGRVLVSTKNKLIKVPELKTENILSTSSNLAKNMQSSPGIFKKVNAIPCKYVGQIEHRKIVHSRTKIINLPVGINKKSGRRHSINNIYNYNKANGIMKKLDKSSMRSTHKIINNTMDTNKYKIKSSFPHIQRNSPTTRKRFVYVNKYNSSSFLANNVILKNTRLKKLININGILYRNSPSTLKKTNLYMNMRQHKASENVSLSTITKLPLSKVKRKLSGNTLKEYQGQYKLVRSRIASATKLKKSNIPCSIYKRFGKCNGQKNGTCIKIHNSDRIILCSKFLQGACIKKNCLLSHKVSPEKMPTCKFFLEGLCSKDDCQYLHVKISPKADICKDFLEGFCKEGTKVFSFKHQFLLKMCRFLKSIPHKYVNYSKVVCVMCGYNAFIQSFSLNSSFHSTCWTLG